jgi:hypothetical protein
MSPLLVPPKPKRFEASGRLGFAPVVLNKFPGGTSLRFIDEITSIHNAKRQPSPSDGPVLLLRSPSARSDFFIESLS